MDTNFSPKCWNFNRFFFVFRYFFGKALKALFICFGISWLLSRILLTCTKLIILSITCDQSTQILFSEFLICPWCVLSMLSLLEVAEAPIFLDRNLINFYTSSNNKMAQKVNIFFRNFLNFRLATPEPYNITKLQGI